MGVLIRLATSGAGSDWPLSRKFGCPASECVHLLRMAASIGLQPPGLSFHVGSQQHDPTAWRAPIEASGQVFRALRRHGLTADLVDLGGGFPAGYLRPHPAFDDYGREIEAALRDTFGPRRPRTLVEPGRGICADAGTIVATVLGVAHRRGQRWADVLYEKHPVELPPALAEGDEVRLHSAGAYTSSYSTVGFNGFPPLPTHLVGPIG